VANFTKPILDFAVLGILLKLLDGDDHDQDQHHHKNRAD
jgi:hypothetical protein